MSSHAEGPALDALSLTPHQAQASSAGLRRRPPVQLFWALYERSLEKAPCRKVNEAGSRLKYLRKTNGKNGAAVAASVVNLRAETYLTDLSASQ
jgi:hypothetical protein